MLRELTCMCTTQIVFYACLPYKNREHVAQSFVQVDTLESGIKSPAKLNILVRVPVPPGWGYTRMFNLPPQRSPTAFLPHPRPTLLCEEIQPLN